MDFTKSIPVFYFPPFLSYKFKAIELVFLQCLNVALMESIKPLLGIAAVCLGLLAYIIYIASTLKNKIKPHAFSWLLWTLTTAIVFTAQIAKGAGAGSWSTGFTCIVCLAIGII